MNDVETIREAFAAFGRGDLDSIGAQMSPDIVWHAPGRSTLAGDYRGIEAIFGYFGQLFERSGGTFRVELLECGEIAPGRVMCEMRMTGSMSGGDIDQRIVQVYQREAGKTVEVWNYSADQYAIDESDSSTPAGLVKRGYAAFATGDMDTLREVLAPDIVWRMPGVSAVAGEHRGIDNVLAFFGTLMERSGGTFRAELIGCAEVVPGTVCAYQRTSGALPGGSLEATTVNVFRIEGGRAVEVIEHLSDNYAYDAAMGGSITLPDARRADQAAPVTT